jgi:hypothetical protein
VWLSKALEVDNSERDANICLGDLFNRSGLFNDAKR